ncbi:MAG: hypothetical protein PHE67_07460 [Campylobacterales bacterium]|nr:hypothetical protein [Campylobacterales bacterium]
MLSIRIDNPELEGFIQDEYKGDDGSLVRQFVEFLKLQKIKSEVKTSLDELDNDDIVELDEAFKQATAKYAAS